MFSFFRKRPRLDVLNMIRELATIIPSKHDAIIRQIEEGIVVGFILEEDAYLKFKLNPSVINRFEDPYRSLLFHFRISA